VEENYLKEIIDGCKKGKRKSQELLYHQFAAKMFAVCLYYAGNKTEAEDFLQSGFIKVFENIKQYQEKGIFEAWLRKIFMHTALTKYREKKLMLLPDYKETEYLLDSNQEDVLSKISTNDLLCLIQQLPPAYRLVFNLYAIEGYSHREIAEMLGLQEGTSKSNLSRARQILQQKLAGQFEISTKKG
jgi:RNA polymerase sigma-70 factor (ECF subfamily)